MKHTTTLNGVISYDLEPESDDDRHLIEIMKGKTSVTMKQSRKGGITFELSKSTEGALPYMPIREFLPEKRESDSVLPEE